MDPKVIILFNLTVLKVSLDNLALLLKEQDLSQGQDSSPDGALPIT